MKRLRSFLLTAGTLFGLQAVYGCYVYFQLICWMVESGFDAMQGGVISLLAAVLLMATIGSSVYCINAWWKLSVSARTTLPELALERGGDTIFMSVMATACLGYFASNGGHDGVGIDSPLGVTVICSMLSFAVCIALSVWKISVYHRLMSKV